MRIPLGKVYRAFPEFDALRDDDCERMVHRVRLTRPRAVPCAIGLVAAAGLVGGGVAAWYAGVRWLGEGATDRPVDRVIAMFAAAVGATVGGGLVALVARDLALWWGLRREVHRARCPKCRHSLLGLPVQFVGLDPGPGDARVRCPECGRVVVLMDHGLRPIDLIPWEQRHVPADYARIRDAAVPRASARGWRQSAADDT